MAKNIKNSRFTNSSIIGEGTSFTVIEAFKAARTNLMFMLDSQSEKNSISFTSYAPKDGKTTSCINLAITFAQTGAKILVIDADMRKPALHRYLKTQAKPGLSETLAGISGNEPNIYKTDIENLFIIPAGSIPPNPTELLISKNMDDLLEHCAPLFDYIFIDTPPLGLVTDAAIVGAKTLGIINVVNCERSRSEDVETIRAIIEQAGIKLIGCIVNSVPITSSSKKYRIKTSNYGYNYGYIDYNYYKKSVHSKEDDDDNTEDNK